MKKHILVVPGDGIGQEVTQVGKKVLEKIQQKSKSVYLVTSGRGDVEKRFPGETVFTCDFTAIKTAARSNPTLYRMNGPVIMQKWGWADFSKIE